MSAAAAGSGMEQYRHFRIGYAWPAEDELREGLAAIWLRSMRASQAETAQEGEKELLLGRRFSLA